MAPRGQGRALYGCPLPAVKRVEASVQCLAPPAARIRSSTPASRYFLARWRRFLRLGGCFRGSGSRRQPFFKRRRSLCRRI